MGATSTIEWTADESPYLEEDVMPDQGQAAYRLRLHSRPSASERQVNTRVGERHWDRRSLFWLEPLPVRENAVPELERPEPLNS